MTSNWTRSISSTNGSHIMDILDRADRITRIISCFDPVTGLLASSSTHANYDARNHEFLFPPGRWCLLVLLPMGAVLCELDLTSKFDSFILPANVSWRNQFFWALLALGLYLGGVPVRGFATMSPVLVADQPGFYYLSYLIPRIYFDVTHFLGTISALCIVTATIALSPLHKFFEMRFFQYLGRISFSLYLCHGPILCTLGMFLYKVVGKSTDSPSDWNNAFAIPMIGPKGIELPVLAANLIILPVTLYASELCLRLFDGPSIHFANWAWQRVNQS
ncbi:hypothetical protein MRB53_040427 [Persea americana]|nr:hypothetical protein MRB53_040427 [Persea americana]